MRAAILAAGQGERLRAAGFLQPKPLVRIAGRPLIDYALTAVADAGIREIACIVNAESIGIEDHCREQWPGLHFDFLRLTTASSMESLLRLAPLLGNQPFVLLTVDAVFSPAMLGTFLSAAAAHTNVDGVLALTQFVDDEKPLRAAVDSEKRIYSLGPAAAASPWITAGFYTFQPSIFREADLALGRFTALRQFLGYLVDSGYRIFGEAVGKSVDVDRSEDIATAEAFVRSGFVP